MDDLLEFGQVQRGLLGVQIIDVDANVADGLGLSVKQGVLVRRVTSGSAAEDSGIKVGDVIVAIEGHKVNSVSELQEWVARNRPGKEISVVFIRGDEKNIVNARLKNNEGSVELTSKEFDREVDGARIEEVSYKDLTRLKLDGGVIVAEVDGGEWVKSGMRDGFVVAFVDKVSIDDVEDFYRIMEYKRGGVLLEGYYLSGEKGSYAIDW
jgi:S1-C subfamily serine protease